MSDVLNFVRDNVVPIGSAFVLLILGVLVQQVGERLTRPRGPRR